MGDQLISRPLPAQDNADIHPWLDRNSYHRSHFWAV